MRKLPIVLLIIGVLAISAGCGSDDEKRASENKQAPAVTITTTDASTPKFKDPEVQKLVDDYTALYKQRDDLKNPEKMVGFIKKAAELKKSTLAMQQKLSSDPGELKKYKEYMLPLIDKLTQEIAK